MRFKILNTSLFPIFTLLFLHHLVPSAASLHKAPIEYFEVTKPIEVPKTKPYSYHILEHDFAYTYGKPPVVAQYSPPSFLKSHNISKIVLEWKATSKGRQFDRILGVWLGGVEIFRSCTAEPTPTGIVWKVEKDVTKYSSLFLKDQEFAVYIGNLIDQAHNGVYHVNVTIHFYPAEEPGKYPEHKLDKSVPVYGLNADLILPISRTLPRDDGLWFKIENSTYIQQKEFRIPRNVYRAVLEIYVSPHENDEFWATNLPNDYISANNFTGQPGNGPFREVLVSLDDKVIGAVWPFPVIYTGGVNPLLWRPITGIGSFNLPSYDLEVTPFLGNILDGNTHKYGFSVTNALNVWYINANLHLWLDTKSTTTRGKLSSHSELPSTRNIVSKFQGLDGTFLTVVTRSISSVGWVKSSHGKIITKSNQNFSYLNKMVMKENGNVQIVHQSIDFKDYVHARMSSSDVLLIESHKIFPFYISSDNLLQSEELYRANFTLGFNEERYENSGFGSFKSSLTNIQDGEGRMLIKDNLVQAGSGSTKQLYKYDSSKFCYSRNISSRNYTILYDNVGHNCSKQKDHHIDFQFKMVWPFSGKAPENFDLAEIVKGL